MTMPLINIVYLFLQRIHKTESADSGFAPIFPDICYHLTHYKPASIDIPVASDNPAHYEMAFVIVSEGLRKFFCSRYPVRFGQ